MSKIFDPLKFGDLSLPNRIIMAPLTRCRAIKNRTPNEMMVKYYTQRASAGLILTEATSISPMGVGYPNTPGIWLDEHINGWQKVTQAVHQENGRIFLQLWHVGRISHPFYLNGELPVAPSAIAAQGHVRLLSNEEAYPVPRALELNEIPGIIELYRQGAINAKLAGFDGVEIHAANGYLIDQFLQDSSNKREDIYGGSIENRVRLLLEITDAVISVWGKNRVGVHLSPRGDTNSMGDSNKLNTFSYAVKELSNKGIAFVFVKESQAADSIAKELKKHFAGVFIANEKFHRDSAIKAIADGDADAVAFGQLFIANPDLCHRLKINASLNQPDPKTFYGMSERGYTDYPFLEDNNKAV